MSGFQKIITTIALVCATMLVAQPDAKSAEMLVSWDLDGLSRAGDTAIEAEPTFVHSAVKSSDLTIAMLVQTPWSDALTVYAKDLWSDLDTAIEMENYFSFTVTPRKGKQISYSSLFNRITINAGDLEKGASIRFDLLSSVTGFTSPKVAVPIKALDSFIVTHPANNDKVTMVENTFNISDIDALQGVDEPVEFRIYAVRVDGVGNRMGFGHIFYQDSKDDLIVTGTVE